MNCNTQNAKIASITEKTLIIGIDVGSIEKSIPIYQREAMKCLGMALASGVCYLLADSLCRE